MAVTHFTDPTLKTAELTIYAELHNGADHEVQGRVEGTAAGAHFEQPVTLASPRGQDGGIFAEATFRN